MSKIKLPKRVAGIKIPKTVRKGAVRDFLNSPAGQLVLAEVVAVAAAAIAAKGTTEEISARLSGGFHAALAAFREELRVDPEVVNTVREKVATRDRKTSAH